MFFQREQTSHLFSTLENDIYNWKHNFEILSDKQTNDRIWDTSNANISSQYDHVMKGRHNEQSFSPWVCVMIQWSK